MSATLKTRTPLEAASVPVPVKLAAAWASFMFLYVDVFNFYKPHVVAGILDGMIWWFQVSPPLLTGMLASVMIPAVMIVLSVTLPPRANRIVNVVVASLYVPYSVFNMAGSSAEWLPFYVVSIGVELALLGFIVRRAWTSVPRREAGALGAER